MHTNISDMPFDQRSLQPPEKGVLNCHTQANRQTSQVFSVKNTIHLLSLMFKIILQLSESGGRSKFCNSGKMLEKYLEAVDQKDKRKI